MSSNDRLRAEVLDELGWEPGLDEHHVHVDVRDSAVTLTGHVPSFAQRFRAVRAVERVAGVRAVADELEVRLPRTDVRDDTDIATAIAHRFDASSTLPKTGVTAEVTDGHVTLNGQVQWDQQRLEAVRLTLDVRGVRHVSNHITLKPGVAAQTVAREIAKAFGRQASLDAHSIDIEVDESTAVLTGHVHSIAERRLAQAAAYAAPGIRQVDNRLAITL